MRLLMTLDKMPGTAHHRLFTQKNGIPTTADVIIDIEAGKP